LLRILDHLFVGSQLTRTKLFHHLADLFLGGSFHINSVTENVDEVTVASLITAIFWPGLTRIISEKLFGIIGDVVMLAVGFVPI
jgi:hypothetical protein